MPPPITAIFKARAAIHSFEQSCGRFQMASVLTFKPGGYRFIKGPFQYSAGACALEGLTLQRVRFCEPQPLNDGFAAVEHHLKLVGRPTQAICGFELRSPEPFTDAGFEAFNR